MSADNSGVPVKLLFQGEGHVVTVELKNGEIYRGQLLAAEDTMNCQLKEVVMTSRDGRVSRLENVFLRGGHIKFIVLPDMLKNSPILKKVQTVKSKKEQGLDTKNSRAGGKPEGQPANKKQRKA
mmetsp:Transcript_7806/g.5855  ORF Transcript_7806/g.5855 Transcript_7806/m.5855 type:complete len:124 (+) Transcript_7806:104-475(+)